MIRPTDDLGRDAILLEPILKTSWRFYVAVLVLGSIAATGVYAYVLQLRDGLGVTGLNRPVYWGIYITNFVFFIGISHAGTLISAILRISGAEWRRAITRSAEVITVLVLVFGVGNILIDLGRIDRIDHILTHGRLQSPLLWDVCSVTVYLICSTIYLYLPLIPDIAILRDQTTRFPWLFRILALGWQGTERQWRRLDRVIPAMAILVIPVAVSVHTVVSFVFAMTVQPMWHSAIFGPYFVAGAIFSGIAALIVAMALIRWVYGLGDYLKDIHFNYLGLLLLVMAVVWFYFTACEYLTTYYGAEPIHMDVFWYKWTGPYRFYFWTMVATCFVIPFAILCNRWTRTLTGTVAASLSVTLGMWLERYVIVVPTLSNPRLPIARGFYTPTWVEGAIFAGCMAMFILVYVLFTKVFPIVSIWEIQEGRHQSGEILERITSYLPADEEPEAAAAAVGAGQSDSGPGAKTESVMDNCAPRLP